MACTHDHAPLSEAYLADGPVNCSQVHTEPTDSLGGSIAETLPVVGPAQLTICRRAE
jgi:hypothetical protein